MQRKFECHQILGGSLLKMSRGWYNANQLGDVFFFEGKLFSRVFVYILTIECRNKSGSKDEKRAMFIENANGGNYPCNYFSY